MDKNNIIILALIVIIVALLVGVVVLMSGVLKQDTILAYKSDSTLSEGDSISFKLTDDNGVAIANQTVSVFIGDVNGYDSQYSVVTNEKGVGTLELDKEPGNYVVKIVYDGSKNYKNSEITQQITVEEVKTTSTSASSQSSSMPYSINNLPPSNDPNPEVRRYQVDDHTVIQEYSDHYRSKVDLRTGERTGGYY